MDQSSEILVEFPPVFRIYKDLRVDRLLGTDAAPAGYDITTGVTSRDVSIDGDTGVHVRLFLPDTALRRPSSSSEEDHGGKRLPVVVFYHGGGFVAMSPASPLYKAFKNWLAGKAGAIVVSVNYRLATEHPFPVGYEDSFHALEWVLSSGGGGGDPWLSRNGDLDRVFLAGDSAGGNIAHNVAVMAADRLDPAAAARVEGVVLLHPAFWGTELIAGETREGAALMETLWSVVCPGAEGGVDDPRMNPLAAPTHHLPCKRLLVCAADGNILRQRARAYYEDVAASGWSGELQWLESKDAGHCFFLHDMDGRESVVLMDRLVAFLAGSGN